MYDHHPNRSWMRPELAGMQVKVVFVSGGDDVVETMSKLNNGEFSLYDYQETMTNNDGHGVHVFNVGTQDFVPVAGEGDYRKFKKTIEITIDKPVYLNVYAACFIDGLNLGNDLLNKFYGPMSAEKIYIGGEVNKETSYFYYPASNIEYGGPVHGHEQTWMEGSKHSTTPHQKLERVIEENYKIKVIEGITDPNELVPDNPGGPQTGDGEGPPPELPDNYYLPGDGVPEYVPDSPAGGGQEISDNFDGSQDISGDFLNEGVDDGGTSVSGNYSTNNGSGTSDPTNQEPRG